MSLNDARRLLPSADRLLNSAPIQALFAPYGRERVLEALRAHLEVARQQLAQGGTLEALTPEAWAERVEQQLRVQFAPLLKSVINATGVIIHTNLGRAPLSQAAQLALQDIGGHYSTLEFDLETGKRGSRYVHAEQALCELTGAQAALVVNNAAAALLLMLSALAKDREVIISRAHLVEIGGGFRIPDIMTQGGAILREVGTTNRTRLNDYAQAISPHTAGFLRVHSSNFKQIGFVEQAELSELADLAHQHNLYLLDDLGSGALLDTARYGLPHEPTVQESVAAGVDLVVFSGDKLLGGPQAGIIVGNNEALRRLKHHPLARALRADKLAYSALSATLDAYRRGRAEQEIPIWQMLARPLSDLQTQAYQWAQAWGASVVAGDSTVGGGSLPDESLPSALVALTVARPDVFLERLRDAVPPIIARIQAEQVLFDPRTVLAGQEMLLERGVGNLLQV